MKEQPDLGGTIRKVGQLPLGVIAGALYPLRALQLLIRTPQLAVCVIFPILVNIAIGVGLSFGLLLPGWRAIDEWTTNIPVWLTQWVASFPLWLSHWMGWLPSWGYFLDDVLRWLLAIALFIATGLLLVQFGVILGAPWYGNLAEQIERIQLGQLPSNSFSLTGAVRDIWRAIAFQLKKLLLMVLIGVPLFLLNFVPIPILSNSIASIGGISLAALLVGLDFLDPPLERRRLSFRAKLGIFGRTLPASGIFSLVCLSLVSIPLLNLLVVPVCVAAGTLFCCDRVLPYLPTPAQKDP